MSDVQQKRDPRKDSVAIFDAIKIVQAFREAICNQTDTPDDPRREVIADHDTAIRVLFEILNQTTKFSLLT